MGLRAGCRWERRLHLPGCSTSPPHNHPRPSSGWNIPPGGREPLPPGQGLGLNFPLQISPFASHLPSVLPLFLVLRQLRWSLPARYESNKGQQHLQRGGPSLPSGLLFFLELLSFTCLVSCVQISDSGLWRVVSTSLCLSSHLMCLCLLSSWNHDRASPGSTVCCSSCSFKSADPRTGAPAPDFAL